jgi:transcriptional regulator with XRE-family HTH domain
MSVGDRLKKLRTEARLTQQALAMKAGLSVSVVAQIEQGVNDDPRLSTLRALAKVLGATMNDLTGNDDEGQEPPQPEPEEPPLKPRRGRPGKPKNKSSE